MSAGLDAWSAVMTRSDQLIAALEDECVAAELIRVNVNEVIRAAIVACSRARLMQEYHDAIRGLLPEAPPPGPAPNAA